MSQFKSHLRAFWPIAGTPYIFCDIQKKHLFQSSFSQTRNTNLLIDRQEGRCVMRVEWHNLIPAKNQERKASRYTEYKGLLIDQNQFSLIYEQIFRYDSSQFQRTSDTQKSNPNNFKKKKDLWRIGLDGRAQKLENSPDFFLQNQSSYRCLNYSNLIAVTSNRLMQYQLEGNDLQQCEGWEEIGDPLMQLCSLPNRGYLFSNTRKGSVVFLQPYEPRIRSFAIRSIFANLPAPPKNSTPWEQLSSLSWQLIPLSIHGESPLLAYFQMPGFPIFEIHLDRIRTGAEQDVFNFLGFSPSCRPFVSMQKNQVILFTNTLVRNGSKLNTGVPIFALEKRANQWPTEYGFTFQPQSISLPASIQRICEIPVDDEYLLAFGQDTFWYTRLDGSVVTPVYPRSGSFRHKRSN